MIHTVLPPNYTTEVLTIEGAVEAYRNGRVVGYPTIRGPRILAALSDGMYGFVAVVKEGGPGAPTFPAFRCREEIDAIRRAVKYGRLVRVTDTVAELEDLSYHKLATLGEPWQGDSPHRKQW